MKDEIFVFQNYQDDVSFETALLKGEVEGEIVTGNTVTQVVRRGDVIEWLDEFICSSYRLNLNPMPQLRKLFPHFRWSFLNTNLGDGTEERVAFSRMCLEADIFWDAYNFTCFVAAFRKKRDVGNIPWQIWGGEPFSKKVPCHHFRAHRVVDREGRVAE